MMGHFVGGGFSWMWIIPMLFVMMAFFGVVVWGISRMVRSGYQHSGYQIGCGRHNRIGTARQEEAALPGSEDAEEILTKRFAEGKIDYEEFEHRLGVIMERKHLKDRGGA